ncbi:MAG: hypothetical protein GY856_01555 [bacterium]|nr:hypothetical protein [bacterium]
MKQELDMDKIAAGLGAKRRGKVKSSGGYFGAMQLAAEVAERLRVPPGGGRATDPTWTERRLIPLSPETLSRLEELAQRLQVAPLQIAAILLEKTVSRIRDEELAQLTRAAGQ